jgi:hypothetical protein
MKTKLKNDTARKRLHFLDLNPGETFIIDDACMPIELRGIILMKLLDNAFSSHNAVTLCKGESFYLLTQTQVMKIEGTFEWNYIYE